MIIQDNFLAQSSIFCQMLNMILLFWSKWEIRLFPWEIKALPLQWQSSTTGTASNTNNLFKTLRKSSRLIGKNLFHERHGFRLTWFIDSPSHAGLFIDSLFSLQVVLLSEELLCCSWDTLTQVDHEKIVRCAVRKLSNSTELVPIGPVLTGQNGEGAVFVAMYKWVDVGPLTDLWFRSVEAAELVLLVAAAQLNPPRRPGWPRTFTVPRCSSHSQSQHMFLCRFVAAVVRFFSLPLLTCLYCLCLFILLLLPLLRCLFDTLPCGFRGCLEYFLRELYSRLLIGLFIQLFLTLSLFRQPFQGPLCDFTFQSRLLETKQSSA